MPKLTGLSIDDLNKTLHGFQYTTVSIDKLGALEYTLVQMTADQTGSVLPFKKDLEKMLEVSFEACKKSPRANNLLYRTTAFNSVFSGPKITELHGFTLLDQVDPSKFNGSLNPDGGMPLIDATLEGVEALYDYSKKLYAKKFTCNAISISFNYISSFVKEMRKSIIHCYLHNIVWQPHGSPHPINTISSSGKIISLANNATCISFNC
jgi:hypothetical protein